MGGTDTAARRLPEIGIFLARPDRTYYMAKGLRERGFKVAHYNTRGYLDDPYIKVSGNGASALARVLRTDHDVYFTSLSFAPSLSLYANRVLRRKPYVFNYTGMKWEMFRERSKGKPFARLLERRLYPFLLDRVLAGASRIVCNSRFLEHAMATRYPQYRNRLLTIYNGVEVERYASGRRRRISGARDDDLIVVSVTSIDYEGKAKGVEVMIDAFGCVWAQCRRVKLVIAAKTSNFQHGERIQGYLGSKPWRDSVIVLYNHGDIPDLLASGDVFVYATRRGSNDSLPRAVLEAQAAGLPVVTTDTAGCPEIVQDGITGFVEPGDDTGLAQRILELIGRPELRREMGRAAHARIRDTFSWDRMADQYGALFLAIAGIRV